MEALVTLRLLWDWLVYIVPLEGFAEYQRHRIDHARHEVRIYRGMGLRPPWITRRLAARVEVA